MRFFKELYHQRRKSVIEIDDSLVHRLSKVDADKLDVMPTKEEIKEAIWCHVTHLKLQDLMGLI